MEVSDAVSEGEGGGSLRDWRLSGLRTSWEGEETGAEWRHGTIAVSRKTRKQQNVTKHWATLRERQEQVSSCLLML